MRLDKLFIAGYKNLQDVAIDFSERTFATVLIGPNHSGKSNLLEALVIIFRNLDLGLPPEFRYQLTYECHGHNIEVDADPGRSRTEVEIKVNGERISPTEFREAPERAFLPTTVFGYYSGTSDRLERLFDPHQRRFYKQLLSGEAKTERPLFYARLIHGQFVLLAFYAFETEPLTDFLPKYLDITGLRSVLFTLHRPYWADARRAANDRFWNARGVVRPFLNYLYDLSLAPFKHQEEVPNAHGTDTVKTEHYYLFLRDLQTLQKLSSSYSSMREFFEALESTYISDLIHEVRVRVDKVGVPEGVAFSALSEGEKQLLTVLGLLRFTYQEGDESLFLLDEPDTQLNPAWKIEYMSLLERVMRPAHRSHIIMATHDPLVMGGLKREQVWIFPSTADGRARPYRPARDPAGMGVEGVLKALFNLRSTVDIGTQQKLDRKRQLELRLRQGELTRRERAELERLNKELEPLGFTAAARDPDFAQYLEARSAHALSEELTLTPEEQRQQADLAREIVARLMRDRQV